MTTIEGQRVPLIVLGLDAADPDLLEQWASEGELPAIASVMEKGCWARTVGAELTAEHGAWLAISTGRSRAEHGFYSYRQLVPGTYDLRPVLGHKVSPPPFWGNLAPDLRVAIVDIPDAPVCPGVAGVQIQDWATHYAYGEPPRGEPLSFLHEVQRQFARRPYVPEKPVSTAEEDRDLFQRLLKRIRLKGEMGRWLLNRKAHDLFFFVFADTHTGGHQMWGTNRKGPDDLRGAMKTLYQAIDREIGQMLETIEGDANIFLVSSLGIKEQFPTEGLGAAFLTLAGFQHPPVDEGVPTRDPLGWFRRLLGPRLRRAINGILPQRIQERLISQKFTSSCDWSKTRMFCIPAYYAGFFRVNLKGREPQGIVSPGREYEELLTEVENELKQLTDPKTGKPAVRSIFRATNIFGPDSTWELPDLFVEWAASDHFCDRLLHPLGEIRQEPAEFFRDSDHTQEGFIAASGPDIQVSGKREDVEVLDLVPTFLHCLGEKADPDLKGSVLEHWMGIESTEAGEKRETG